MGGCTWTGKGGYPELSNSVRYFSHTSAIFAQTLVFSSFQTPLPRMSSQRAPGGNRRHLTCSDAPPSLTLVSNSVGEEDSLRCSVGPKKSPAGKKMGKTWNNENRRAVSGKCENSFSGFSFPPPGCTRNHFLQGTFKNLKMN